MSLTEGGGAAVLNVFLRNVLNPFSYTTSQVELALFTQAVASPPAAPVEPPDGDVSVTGEVANANAYDRTVIPLATAASEGVPAVGQAQISNSGPIDFPTATPGAWADGVSLWVGGWAIYDTHGTPASRQAIWVGAFQQAKPVLPEDTVKILTGNLVLQAD